jgi:hypothetical protein
MIDFETVREISDSGSSFVSVCNYNYFMPSVYELCRELVNVTLNSSWLRKEEVANHGDVVRHLDRG